MANYDFSTLNDRDLEELSRDLISKKLNLEFQSFKPGSDKGIDLRYSTINDNNEIVVQVKHYLRSGITRLKYDLRHSEVSKVKSLNPKRYIFCTSLPLSPQDKDDIVEIFTPFIKSASDVIGSEDLNKWLEDCPAIQERHFKLWLSSIEIIKRIVKNSVKGRSEFYKEKIEKNISLYVPNKTHNQAVTTLNNYNFILITGAPGIGKSTLANVLAYQLLAEDFELIYVREIVEAEEAFSSEKRQVFYFDDFLGAITLDLYSSRNADSAIVSFIDRIRADKFKRLILTCRTTILNQAKSISDKIHNSNIEISNYEVVLENYTNWDKARILYNHLYISDLEQEQKLIFFQNNFHWKVIKHRYYNPRLIQGITNKTNTNQKQYSEALVLEILNDPKKIWSQPFNIQISNPSKLLLLTMYSLGGGIYYITEDKLKQAFTARIAYEVKENNYQRIGTEYNLALKELVGSFIIRTIDKDQVRYSFFNPSLEDFIFEYYQNAIEEYLHVLKASVFFEQFKYRITTESFLGEKRINFSPLIIREKLYQIFNEKKDTLEGYYYTDNLINTISVITRLFQRDEDEIDIVSKINQIDVSYLNWIDRENLTEILKYAAHNDLTSQIEDLPHLITLLSADATSYYQIITFAELINGNDSYFELIKNAKEDQSEYYTEIQNNIDSSWDKFSDDYMTDTYGIDKTTDVEELASIISKRKEEAGKINKKIGLEDSDAIIQYDFDTSTQISFNKEKNSNQDIKIQGYQEEARNEIMDINRLFNSTETDSNLPF